MHMHMYYAHVHVHGTSHTFSMHTCDVWARTYVCTGLRACVRHVCIRVYACGCVSASVHARLPGAQATKQPYTCTCPSACPCAYAHTHTHTRTHTHTHTHTQIYIYVCIYIYIPIYVYVQVSKQLDGDQAELVNLEGPQEEFQGAVMAGMRVLVAALETRVAGALLAMTRVRWGEMEEMGDDTSAYMTEIVGRLREMLPQLGESLLPCARSRTATRGHTRPHATHATPHAATPVHPFTHSPAHPLTHAPLLTPLWHARPAPPWGHRLYVRWFCDKLVASFVPRLIGSIYRCRRIGEAGAQQIQMDVGTLKAALLDLPALGQARCLPPPCSAHPYFFADLSSDSVPPACAVEHHPYVCMRSAVPSLCGYSAAASLRSPVRTRPARRGRTRSW